MKIKFIGPCLAGFPSPAADYSEKSLDLNSRLIKHPASTFYFEVEGDSMKDANIPDKSLLIVDRSLKPANNAIVVASLNGEFVVKHLVKTFKGYSLVPANAKYKTVEVTEEMNFLVYGVVTSVVIEKLCL